MVYRLGSIGDMVVAIPALRHIRSVHPTARIVLLTNRPAHEKAAPAASILVGTPYIDEVVSYELRERRPWKLLKLIGAMRRHRCAVAYYLVSGPKARIERDRRFLRLLGVPTIVGADPIDSQYLPNGVESVSEATLLLQRAGGSPRSRVELQQEANLCLTETERETAEALLRSAGLEGKGFVGFSLGSKCDVKDWGDPSWSQVLQQFSTSRDPLALVAIGTESERARTERLLLSWKGPSVNLCGRTAPREAAAVLEHALLFLGHDSGPMHLAAAVGLRCVAIFSARSLPGRWFPLGPGHRILYRTPECMGCELEICFEKQKACITAIAPGEVLEALENLHRQLPVLA